jgi:hypothetical protein
MTREAIIDAVKAKLEEFSPYGSGLAVLSDSGDSSIRDYIDSVLDEAADEVRLLLPLKFIAGSHLLAGGVQMYVSADNVGTILLPSDFLRVHTIRHWSWSGSVHKALFAEHPDYVLQKNPYTRGKCMRPVVVVDDDAASKVLALYSVSSGDLVSDLYVSRRVAEACEAGVLPYIILMSAIKVSDILERYDSAKAFRQEMSEKLQLVNN